MHIQEAKPTGGASAGYFLEGLNNFWTATNHLTDGQIAETRRTAMYGGKLTLPGLEVVVPQISANIETARAYVGWLEKHLGLAVLVSVDGQAMLVRDFGFDTDDFYYAALATPVAAPSIELQVPLSEPYPLGFVDSGRLPPDQRNVFTRLLATQIVS